ncbi:MAG: hypothetical protein ABIE55_03385, partial [Candidatus Aenigmatarchaeota archaeon]
GCRVFLDKNISIKAALEPDYSGNIEFLQYIKQNPRMALSTKEDLNHCRRKIEKRAGCNDADVWNRFRDLRKVLKLEKIGYSNINEKMKKVDTIYSRIVDDLRKRVGYPAHVTPFFKNIFISNIYCENDWRTRRMVDKLIVQPVEEEDKRIISVSACLKERYGDIEMFLASDDFHISCPAVARSLKEEFDLIAGMPSHLLPKIKECH